MKYYSKSPEEWKKEDESKGVKERIDYLRKRAWLFLIINILIVFVAVIMVRYYVSLAPEKGRVGPLNVIIRMKDPDAIYTLGEPITASISVQNTSKRLTGFSLGEFQLVILDSDGTVKYSFSRKVDYEGELKGFEVIPIFNLTDWDLLSDLEPGKYTLKVSMKVNGVLVTMARSFSVVEHYDIVVEGMKDFYFLGEIPLYVIGVENGNLKETKIKITEASVRLEDAEGRKVEERKFTVNEEYDLPEKGATKVMEFSPRIKFDRLGEYKMTVTFHTDKGVLQAVRTFSVISKSMLSIKDVRVLIESPLYVKSGEKFAVKIFLYNDSQDNRFILVDSGSFFIEGKGKITGEKVEGLRVRLGRNEKVKVFEKSVALKETGEYKITALFKTKKGDLYKELSLKVAGVGGEGK